MAIQHRFLLLICTLCYVAIIHGYLLGINDAETCNLLCGQCNASGVFANGLCECSFTDNNNEECVQRIQKEIQAIDLNIVSDDSTDEERNVRSILRRRRLRFGNADNTNQNDAEYTSNIEAASPSVVYPSSGLYDLTNSLLGAISHPHRTHKHGLHHVLLKTAALPAHALHNLFTPHHHHHPIYHHGIVRSAYPQSIPYVGHQFGRCENNGGSVDPSVSSIAINNADKPIEHNVAASIPVSVDQVQYSPHALYTYDPNVVQPVQYQPFSYPYRYVYHNPVFKVLYPATDNYYVRPDTYIHQGTSGPMISAPNPYHYCINNANTEQPGTVQPVIGDSLYSNNEAEKSDAITDNISKKEKKTEKDGNIKL